MIHTIKEFNDYWITESDRTQKLLNVLTDLSLNQPVINDHRTLGRIAWHIVLSIPEMMNRTGLNIDILKNYSSMPKSAKEIKDIYYKISKNLIEQINEKWNDDTLNDEDKMYGQKWKKGYALFVLICHQTHHRGQMTILMRQAGLNVPGIYGPSKEEWYKFGMAEPEV